MSTVSAPRAYASFLPVVGPVVGFFNRIESLEDAYQVGEGKYTYVQIADRKCHYAANTIVGSILTVVTAIALAALSFSAAAPASAIAPISLFVLGAVGISHNVKVFNEYELILKVQSGNR